MLQANLSVRSCLVSLSRFFALFLAVLFLGIQTAHAQAVSGTITGFVYDPSGVAVPSAKVTATNVETGVATSRNTDVTGVYVITNLLPGTYSVAAEAPGFQRLVEENIVLRVDSKVNVDLHLTMGALSQEVTVNA